MRIQPVVPLIVGLAVASCDDGTEPSAPGTLVVSTSTSGNEPDPDGYLLTIDGAQSLALDQSGTIEAELLSGRHSLRLLGVAEHCSVASPTSVEVDVPPGGTTAVAFAVNCATTGARISTTSTGADIDPNGFRVVVDGIDRGVVGSNSSVLIRIDPGSRTIELTGLASNCTIDGSASHTVPIVDIEVTALAFEVVCTATTGVIGVSIDASGADVEGAYTVTVDGTRLFPVGPESPFYIPLVPHGDHVVSLQAPFNCSVENGERSVAVTAGEITRDTVAITFPVSCVSSAAALRITAPTTGRLPEGHYSVWSCADDFYCFYFWELLGSLDPNGTLIAPVTAGSYSISLSDVPARCRVEVGNPTEVLTLLPGDTLDVEFPVTCSS